MGGARMAGRGETAADHRQPYGISKNGAGKGEKMSRTELDELWKVWCLRVEMDRAGAATWDATGAARRDRGVVWDRMRPALCDRSVKRGDRGETAAWHNRGRER